MFGGTLTPVLVPARRRAVSWRPALLAGLVGCGRVGAGGGHRACKVGVHVVRVGATHGAAGRCRRYGRNAADTERSAERSAGRDVCMQQTGPTHHSNTSSVYRLNANFSYRCKNSQPPESLRSAAAECRRVPGLSGSRAGARQGVGG